MLLFDGKTIDINYLPHSHSFSLTDFKTDQKLVQDVSVLAVALDDYQYLLCSQITKLERDDRRWKEYAKVRLTIINLLTSLHATLIAFKEDLSDCF
jgi:hypothetical protein